jgi:hypothetical protein
MSLAGGLTRTPVRGWIVVLLARLQTSSIILTSYTFGVFLPFISHDLHLSPLEAGLLQSAWWVTSALLALPCSVWFSRVPAGAAGAGLAAPGPAFSCVARTGEDVPQLVPGAVGLCALSLDLHPGTPAPAPAVGRPTAVCPAECRGPLAPQPAPGGGHQLECLANRHGRAAGVSVYGLHSGFLVAADTGLVAHRRGRSTRRCRDSRTPWRRHSPPHCARSALIPQGWVLGIRCWRSRRPGRPSSRFFPPSSWSKMACRLHAVGRSGFFILRAHSLCAPWRCHRQTRAARKLLLMGPGAL